MVLQEIKFCSPLNHRGGICCGWGVLCTSPLDESYSFDYDLHYDHIKIFCDNFSTIHMTKNVNQHSKTKYIEIRYHFLRDHHEKCDIEIDYVSTEFQLTDIFTKALDFNRLSFICGELNVCIID